MREIDEDKQVVRRLLPMVPAEAQKVGSQHAAWDLIFDAEALLAGRPADPVAVRVPRQGDGGVPRHAGKQRAAGCRIRQRGVTRKTMIEWKDVQVDLQPRTALFWRRPAGHGAERTCIPRRSSSGGPGQSC